MYKRQALGNPVPIYGMLNITSTPGDALIRLNGQEYGRTPALLKDILIGTYTLELSKEGYARESGEITIEEGKVLPVNIEVFQLFDNFNLRCEKVILHT